MIPSLMQRFIRLGTAQEIWKAVSKTFYDGSDETRIFELNRKSFTTLQNCRPLSTYYNELIAIFQEIDHRSTTQEDTVEGVIQLSTSMQRLRVHIFLSGLDSDFDQVRGEILRKEPKLDLESSYAYVRMVEQQKKTMGNSSVNTESTVMAVNRLNLEGSAAITNRPRQGPPPGFPQTKPGASQQSFQPRNSSFIRPGGLVCHHCGEAGHSKWKCYEIVGYPEWWDFTKKPRKNIKGKAAVATTETSKKTDTCSLPQANVTQTGHPNPEDSWLWC
ncbi:putative transcription factor interactor and regulator CCHC(Zn) family [Rosa chinensis]|nr:putative transcription factor interactor and regulator CCHC(Zn) family [Rosa chinensis]